MKIKQISFTILVLSLLVLNAFGQKMVKLDKLLNDRAGEYGQALSPIFEDAPGNARKQQSMKPFVVGFYGWKAMKLTELGVGKVEAAHLNICRIMLSVYDPEIDQTLRTIVSRATSPTDWQDLSETEKGVIQKFVVQKYGGNYLGVNAAIRGDLKSKPDEVEKWKYTFGMAMGELAGHLTNWYKLPNNPAYHKKISEDLLGLEKIASSAPSTISPQVVSSIRKLSALGNKTQFTEAERDNIAATIKDTLFSTLTFY